MLQLAKILNNLKWQSKYTNGVSSDADRRFLLKIDSGYNVIFLFQKSINRLFSDLRTIMSEFIKVKFKTLILTLFSFYARSQYEC